MAQLGETFKVAGELGSSERGIGKPHVLIQLFWQCWLNLLPYRTSQTLSAIKSYLKLIWWIKIINYSGLSSSLLCNMQYHWNEQGAAASITVGTIISSFSSLLNLKYLLCTLWNEWKVVFFFFIHSQVFLYYFFKFHILFICHFLNPFQVIWIWLVKSKSSKQRTILGWHQ